MHKQITSTQNKLIRSLVGLSEKSKVRKQSGTFLVEGQRELQLALAGNYEIKQVFYNKALLSNQFNFECFSTQDIFEVSKEVYEKIAYRASTEGIIAVVATQSLALNELEFSTKAPLILVAEAPEKPGNIGAILRTADAANVDAVLIANPKTDLYNPNIIRSSVGCVFTNQIAMGSTEEIIKYLEEQQVSIYAAALHEESQNYDDQNYTQPTAIVVGTEATGLSDDWLKNNNIQKIIIPMQGSIDSMNVSVALGIITYEAKRQRKFK